MADLFYYESGYIDEKYFVYTADAAAGLNSQATVTAIIGHQYGVDIQAFTNASLTTSAVVIRSAQASLDAQSSISFDGKIYALRSADLSSEFAQTVSANRFREPQISLQSQFTVDAIGTINAVIEGHADLTAQSTLSIAPILYKDMAADMYADAVCDPDGVQRVRSFDSNQNSQFTQTAVNYRIVQGSSDFQALFSPGMTVEAVRNVFAVLDSTSALGVVARANRSASVTLSSIITLSLQGDRIRGYAVNLSSQAQLAVQYIAYNPGQAQLQSTATLVANNVRTRSFSSSLNSAFTTSITAKKTIGASSSLTSQFTVTATAKRTRTTTTSLTSTVTLVANAEAVNARQLFINGLYGTGTFSSLASAKDSVGNVYVLMRANTNTVIAKFDPKGKFVSQTELDTPTISTNAKLILNGTDLYGLVNYDESVTDWIGGTSISYNRAKLFKFNTLNNTITWTKTTGRSYGDFGATGHHYTGSGSCVVTGGKHDELYSITDFDVYNNNLYLVGYNRFRQYDGSSLQYDAYRRIQARVDSTGTTQWFKIYDVRSQSTSCPPTSTPVIQTAPTVYNLKIRARSTGLYLAGNFGNSNNLFNNTGRGSVIQTSLAGSTQYIFSSGISTSDFDDVLVDSSSNIISITNDNVNNQLLVTSMTSAGVKNWGVTLPTATTFSRSAYIDSTDNIYVNYRSSTNGDYVVKLSNTGSVVWSKRLYASDGLLTVNKLEVLDDYLNIECIWNNRAIEVQILADGTDGDLTRIVPAPFSGTIYCLNTSVTASSNAYTVSRTTYSESNLPSPGNVYVTTYSNETLFTEQYFNGSTWTYTLLDTSLVPTTSTYTVPNILVIVYSDAINASSAFTQTAVNRRIRFATASISSAFTQTTTAKKTARAQATLTSTATLTPNGGYIRGATASLTSTATVVARLGLIKRHQAQLSTQFNLLAQPRYYKGVGASLFSTSTMSATLGLIKRTAITLQAFNTEVAVVNRIGRGFITMDSVATQTTVPVKTARTPVTLISVATQVSDVRKIARTSASMTAQATVSINFVKIPRTTANLTASASLTVNTESSRTRTVIGQLNTAFTVQAQPVTGKQAQAQLLSSSSVTAVAMRNRLTAVQMSAVSTSTTVAVKTARAQANLQAFDTVLAVGSKIAFDKQLQLLIPNESGSLIVPEENTLLYVPAETRVNMVRKIAI